MKPALYEPDVPNGDDGRAHDTVAVPPFNEMMLSGIISL
jgi:hypothetical protein